MTSADVLEVLDLLGELDPCVDGGWGVDALLGEETRPHADLDVAIAREVAERAATSLAAAGFAHDGTAEPGLPARVVLRDGAGRQVDLHLVEHDEEGNGWQRLGEDAWGLYPAAEVTATGSIDGRPVRCISAALQLRFHLGWEWDAKARSDLGRLRARFGIPLPPERR